MRETTREDTLLHLLSVNRELAGDVMVEGSLGHSDHKMIDLIIGELKRSVSRSWTSKGHTLASLGDWLRESLGRQS